MERFKRLQAAHAGEQINVRSALRAAEWALELASAMVASYGKAFMLLGQRHFKFTGDVVGDVRYEQHGQFGTAQIEAFNARAKARVELKAAPLGRLGDDITLTVSGHRWNDSKACERYSLCANVGELALHVLTGSRIGKDVSPVGLTQHIVHRTLMGEPSIAYLVYHIPDDLEGRTSASDDSWRTPVAGIHPPGARAVHALFIALSCPRALPLPHYTHFP